MKYALLSVLMLALPLFARAEAAGDGPVEKGEADLLKPVLKSWLDFYNIDIYEFRKVTEEEGCSLESLAISEDTASIYYRKFDRERDDVYLPVIYDYSPDKRFYLNLL
jgi:hypothetical protein